MSTKSPCRLYFLLAREAPIAVIFRRGPSKQVQLIKWHTDTDVFEPGQWFKGRIYEDRCDLSPSGELLVYGAVKYGKNPNYDIGPGAWMAISRPPYVTPLAICPGDTWSNLGGIFESEDRVFVEAAQFIRVGNIGADPPPKLTVGSLWELISYSHPDHERGYRLTRDGWLTLREWKKALRRGSGLHVLSRFFHYSTPSVDNVISLVNHSNLEDGLAPLAPDIRIKMHLNGEYALVMLRAFTAYTPQTKVFVIINEIAILLENATCADWDHRDRLVYAVDGKLFEGKVEAGKVIPRELADFNPNKFQPVEAPDWAKQW